MRTRMLLAGIVVATILLSSLSCAKKENVPQGKSAPAAPSKSQAPSKTPAPQSTPAPKPQSGSLGAATGSSAYFGQALVAWNGGNKDEAIKQFVAMRWDDPLVFQGVPVLTMTEQQLAALSQVQRDQVAQQAQDLLKTIREMAKAVVSAGDNLATGGNVAGAKAYFEAVQRFGQSLAGPDHLSIVQLVGKAVTQLAQDKLPTK